MAHGAAVGSTQPSIRVSGSAARLFGAFGVHEAAETLRGVQTLKQDNVADQYQTIPKVVHVITGLNAFGAETALCRLLEALRSRDHVVIALGGENALSARAAGSATVHHLGMRAGRFALGDALRLRRLIRDAQPDVIHGWMYHANLMAAIAGIGLGIPMVWGIRHSLHDFALEKRTMRWVIRLSAWLSRLPARILYNSAVSAAQHAAFGFSERRAEVIPNGFETQAFAPDEAARHRIRAELAIPPDSLAVGLIARVHPMKDHANFLRAAASFAQSNPRAVFVLVGVGADADNFRLLDLVRQLKLGEHLRLCGPRDDIAAIDNALDIACSSSSWGEAFPNAIAEAMACGVPSVATDVGDVRQIVGDTGVVVPPRDAEALAKGWAKVAALGVEGRLSLGVRARARIIERYTLASIARQYADLYDSIVGKSRKCAE
jgi:glycosyltransferase involved in cell wall biosynthesis